MTIGTLYYQAIGLFVFFPVLCTITVGLRMFVRTRLCKGAFGWDDVALLVTYVGLIIWVVFAWSSIEAGFGADRWAIFNYGKNIVCYIISGVVKISVALVIYRLDDRWFIRAILIADMILCAVWTVVATLILSLGCDPLAPFDLGIPVCRGANYAQEISYVFFNVLHLIIPIVILWGVQVRGNLKWAVTGLFSIGSLAAVAAIMKLLVYIQLYNATPDTDYVVLWYRSMIWAVAEHGLSLFAASVLAVRPFFTFVSESLTTLSSSLSASKGTSRASKYMSGASTSGTASSGRPRQSEWDGPTARPQNNRMASYRTYHPEQDFELEDSPNWIGVGGSPGLTKVEPAVTACSVGSSKMSHEHKSLRDAGEVV